MDKKLIECVPNFSEGQDKEKIEKIASAIRETKGVNLLGVDPGSSTNRTVYTFVGCPEAVIEGALNAAKTAYNLIDMTTHKGEHPRLGAMDVCPLVPVRNSTMEDCVLCAEILGEKLAKELNIPIFLYGEASKKSYRKTVPQIRAGEYEGLDKRIVKEEWTPDFGPAEFQPKWGASMVGARKFLLAYNVNMLATKQQAHRIALDVRETGRGPGKEGKLKAVQGLGWYLEEENIAQISYNIIDHDITPLHAVYEESVAIAKTLKVSVVGSELVGLVPLSAILAAAEFYIEKESLFILDTEHKVRLAIERLGLNSLNQFNPRERIIDWKVESTDPPRPLLDITVDKFVREVRARTAAPGGGSVAALIGSLGASLGSMVGLLSYGKRQWEHSDEQMREIIRPLYETAENILPLVEADSKTFELYVKACSETKDPNSIRAQSALLDTINVPLELARKLADLWEPMEKICQLGNPNCLSDMQVGVKCLETGIWGARCVVLVNSDSLTDTSLRDKLNKEVDDLYKEAKEKTENILAGMETTK